MQGRTFLNAEQTADAVRRSNLSCVRSEQLIMQFGVSLEAGRGYALSEEEMAWLQEHPKVQSHPLICPVLKILCVLSARDFSACG